MANALDQLREMTVVVADTGNLEAVKKYQPVDCTTNPSLVLAALSDDASKELVQAEVEKGRAAGKTAEQITDTLTVAIGAELSKLVPGRVSTEVDACLSFDTDASVKRARDIIADYESRGISKDRILIKLASTWEGIRAAEILQKEGIDCNLTLLFSMAQAVACADAGAFLISPFVGRITDWYKKAEGVDGYEPNEDPGVLSVRRIYSYYKSNNIDTVVMGASFRSVGQIKALAGCDNLTIGPKFLDELENDNSTLERALSPDTVEAMPAVKMDEATFRWEMNEDQMASEKLAEGIRLFNADHQKLIKIIGDLASA
ncbi:MAG: transaldolase [Pseudomonadota bacterium]|mgnify:CR=1 FL=1|uniref:Transaldolase n=1 Tax=Thalassococcus halodurans TaxID=373675 RepID=A0A1H6BQY3_9RHOB|nr:MULTISPECIES: transaldolase [Thalassococcus]MBO6868170.1 transaldolase [Thalassococcus sp.]MEC8581840.1 transaldolase [Pseudomonadota bacterium]SEG63094.1 transaldolase [Thalassococcus halodurans]